MQTIKIDHWTDVPWNFTGIAEYVCGSGKIWHLNGKWHREDGPAIEFVNGGKGWYINGKCLGVFDPVVPFVFLEEFVNEEGKKQIKVLIQEGIDIWPNLPGLKELANNWRT